MEIDEAKKIKKQKALEKRLYRRRRNVLIVMSEMIVMLILAIGVFGVSLLKSYDYQELSDNVYKEKLTYATPDNIEDPEKVGYRNILIIGVDESEMNTDVMIVASINNATGEIKLVSILRDTVMKSEPSSTAYPYIKANAQYYSGISDTVSMINRNLGLDISEYVVVNWYAVATVVNQLGGIDLTIPSEKFLAAFNGYLTAVNDATGIWAPQFDAPGTYHMSGTQVVAFCRVRYAGINDTGRTANQREAIMKILEKAKQLAKAGDINTILNAAQTALRNVRSNLKLSEMLYLATEINSYKIADNRQFPVSYQSAQILGNMATKYKLIDPLVATDFQQEVKELHEFLFQDSEYVPNEFIQSISEQMYIDRIGDD